MCEDTNSKALKEFRESVQRLEQYNEELDKFVTEMRARSFMEYTDDEGAENYAKRMMTHLLKWKYCTTDRAHGSWIDDISHQQAGLIKALSGKGKLGKKGPTKNNIKAMKQHLQHAYDNAIHDYMVIVDRSGIRYDDLPPIPGVVPNECPWELEDLLDNRDADGKPVLQDDDKNLKDERFTTVIERLIEVLPEYDAKKVDKAKVDAYEDERDANAAKK